jgi:hypothetical protein
MSILERRAAALDADGSRHLFDPGGGEVFQLDADERMSGAPWERNLGWIFRPMGVLKVSTWWLANRTTGNKNRAAAGP